MSRVKAGQIKSCGCKKCRNRFVPENLTGKHFGKLIADHIVEKPYNVKTEGTYWFCKCDCGGSNIVRASDLKRLHITSCGHCQINEYDLSGRYGVGYTSNNEEFYFDLEDYNLIRSYTWNINADGYVFAFDERVNGKQKYVYMHRLVMGLDEEDDYIIDHRYHKKNDNRKEQLRITTTQNNNRNASLAKNNTSGVTGVSWNKSMNQWRAMITVDYKDIVIGYSSNYNEAVVMRKQAEDKYFGEYSYDNSIKEELKIE